MSIRRVPFAFGEYFHIYNRGNSKQDIFRDSLDKDRFQALLYLANGTVPFVFREVAKNDVFDFERGEPLVAIGAYCLMPNHFHILLTPIVEGGVQTFMQKLSTGYSMYFNKKYARTGVLFEGKFRAQHADSDEYVKYLYSYIHLNPVKLIQGDWKEVGIHDLDEARDYVSRYQHSSLPDYLGSREEGVILDAKKFPEYFKDKKEVDKEMLEWLTYSKFLFLHANMQTTNTEARPM